MKVLISEVNKFIKKFFYTITAISIFTALIVYIVVFITNKKISLKRKFFKKNSKIELTYQKSTDYCLDKIELFPDIIVLKKYNNIKSNNEKIKFLKKININKIKNKYLKTYFLQNLMKFYIKRKLLKPAKKLLDKNKAFIKENIPSLYFYVLLKTEKSFKKRKKYATMLLKRFPLSEFSKEYIKYAKYLNEKEIIDFSIKNIKVKRFSTFRRALYYIKNPDIKKLLLAYYYNKRRYHLRAIKLSKELLSSNNNKVQKNAISIFLNSSYRIDGISGIDKASNTLSKKNILNSSEAIKIANYYYAKLVLNRAFKFYSKTKEFNISQADKDFVNDKIIRIFIAFGLYKKAEELLKQSLKTKSNPSHKFMLARLKEKTSKTLSIKLYNEIASNFFYHYYGMKSIERLKVLKTKPELNNSKLKLSPSIYKNELKKILCKSFLFYNEGFIKGAEEEIRRLHNLYTGNESFILKAYMYSLLDNPFKSHISLIKVDGNYAYNFPKKFLYFSYPLSKYFKHIKFYAKKYEVDPIFTISLVRQESFFQEKALSFAGAMGLMQLLYSTAKHQAKKSGIKLRRKRELYNPQKNIEIGVAHLKDLFLEFKNKVDVLCAYNAGKHRVYKWRNILKNIPEEFYIELIPFTQTRKYVKIILTNERIYRILYYEQN